MAIDFSGVEQTYGQADQANTELANLTSAGGKLESMLRDTLSQKFSSSPLTQQVETQRQKVMSSPEEIRASMAQTVKTNPLSPNQQQLVSSQQQAANVAPLITLNDLLNIRTGSIDDVLRGGLNAYNSQVQAQQLQAQNLRQSANDQLNLLLSKAAEERANQELALKQSTATGTTDWLSGLMGGAQPTEPKPAYSPSKLNEISKGGEWKFTGKDWEPISTGGTGLSMLTPEVLASGVLSGNLNAAQASLLGKLSGAIPSASAQKKADEDSKLKGIINSLSGLKNKMTGVKNLSLVNYKMYNQTRDLVGMAVAKLYESGRMSDQDRDFYLKSFPSYAYATIDPNGAKKIIDNLISTTNERLNNPSTTSNSNQELYSSADWEVVE
jgi:hypothetical protein